MPRHGARQEPDEDGSLCSHGTRRHEMFVLMNHAGNIGSRVSPFTDDLSWERDMWGAEDREKGMRLLEGLGRTRLWELETTKPAGGFWVALRFGMRMVDNEKVCLHSPSKTW